MSLDDALSHMELVGHDFYLFADAESGHPAWSTGGRDTTTA